MDAETVELQRHVSDSGKREAIVYMTDEGYIVEFYERSRCINSFTFGDRRITTLQQAHDLAENFTLGTEDYRL